MERIDYLGSLRRRWAVLGLAVLVGILAGWQVGSATTPAPQEYEAGTPVLGSSDPKVTNLSTLAALTTIGEVPRRAAEALHHEGDPGELAAQITTSPDQGTGILWVGARAATPRRAELLADTFANQLVDWVSEEQLRGSRIEARQLQKRMDRLAGQIAGLQARTGAGGKNAALLLAEQEAKLRHFGALAERQQQVADSMLRPGPLRVVQPARAGPVPRETLLGPITAPSRLAVGGALGLLAGLALVLVLERFDPRIRTRAAAERSFRLPVLAEIPPLRRRERRAVVGRRGGISPSTDQFRLLGTILAQDLSVGPPGNGGGPSSSRTILVTSPGPAEGKTRVVGSLGAMYATSGKRVLILSCDFRRPGIHRLFGASNERGLTDALTTGGNGGLVEPLAQPTALPELRIVPSGPLIENPSELLASPRMRTVLQQAREAADIVLVDTPSLLPDGDAAYLLHDVDAVLVVARAGKTTTAEAERTSEILERLDAPVAGVALNASGG